MSGTATVDATLDASDPYAREAQTFLRLDYLKLDTKGFVETGRTIEGGLVLQCATIAPGIFAVGDVRSGSVKRVASGVGEGLAAIQAVRHVLNSCAA